MVVVVIPCYRVKRHILDVIKGIGEEVQKILVIDDKCPEESGKYVLENNKDPRVEVLFHPQNKGVGGAVKTGYIRALELNADIVIKIDGDGQMDTSILYKFIRVIERGEADYVKGNRFFNIDTLQRMPAMRLFGNSVLSILNKFINGYWNIMDPTNGYTAIHRNALTLLPLDKIENRYFFESDMLFRLSTIRAVVYDQPIPAFYGDEKSSLKISKVLFEFPPKYFVRFFKRIFYNYFLRDFNAASVEMVVGLLLFLFGGILGIYLWISHVRANINATSGTVMLTALPVIIGFQLLLSSLNYDIQNIPNKPLSKMDF